jgi:hypothetical protein
MQPFGHSANVAVSINKNYRVHLCRCCCWLQSTSQVLRLRTTFPYRVLSLSTEPEVAWLALTCLGRYSGVEKWMDGPPYALNRG